MLTHMYCTVHTPDYAVIVIESLCFLYIDKLHAAEWTLHDMYSSKRTCS